MQDALDSVRQFHEKMGLAIGDPRNPNLDQDRELRLDLIGEEFGELLVAMGGHKSVPNPEYVSPEETPDVPELELVPFESREEQHLAVADALGDLSYTVAGAALAWGIPLGEIFDEIHRSNMTKSPSEKREDGKVLKGQGYSPPDLKTAWNDAAAFEDFMEQHEQEPPACSCEDDEPTQVHKAAPRHIDRETAASHHLTGYGD